jgi:transcriptional regulator
VPNVFSPHRLRGGHGVSPFGPHAGTLNPLVLRTLVSGRKHGYGIATLFHRRTEGDLAVEDAALYQALHRLDRENLVQAEWRQSENNRRARYYTLTPAGRNRLRADAANWRRYSRAVEGVLEGISQEC